MQNFSVPNPRDRVNVEPGFEQKVEPDPMLSKFDHFGSETNRSQALGQVICLMRFDNHPSLRQVSGFERFSITCGAFCIRSALLGRERAAFEWHGRHCSTAVLAFLVFSYRQSRVFEGRHVTIVEEAKKSTTTVSLSRHESRSHAPQTGWMSCHNSWEARRWGGATRKCIEMQRLDHSCSIIWSR